MSVTASTNLWRPLAISAVLVFVYGVVLVKLGHDWWTDENYSHGLLIPFIIGYIVWTQREHFTRDEARPGTILGGALVLLALLMLFAGTAGAELFLQRISLVVMFVGLVIFFWGHRFLKLLWVPIGLLVLAIPIPAIIFNKVAFPLQLFASRCAVWSMSMWGIPVLRQGNVIELLPRGALETRKLEVVEACSGIRSLMTLLTLAVVFAYFTYPNPTNGDDDKGNGGLSWLKSLRVLAFGNHRYFGGADRNPDKRIARERYWRVVSLLRNRSGRRFLPLVLGMGNLYRRFPDVVCCRLGDRSLSTGPL